jgi:integrase
MPTPVLRVIPDGTYYAFWSENRRSQRKSMGTRDRAEAEARFAHWLLTRNSVDIGNPTSAFTVADCWAAYDQRHIQKNVASPDTLRFAWKRLEPHFGHLPAQALDQAAVDAYVAKRLASVKEPTIRRELSALVAALNFCAMPAIKMIPAGSVPKLALPAGGEPRDRWLTTAEMQRLLTAAAALRRGDRLSRGERFLWLALGTAGRKSAIYDLTWDRVDFETGVVHLDVPGRKRTKKRRASVPMSKELRAVLERAHSERISDLVLDNKGEVWATVQLIAIEAGFGGKRPAVLRSEKPRATGISPHVLRHTAATHMARNGVPLWKIAKVLGNTMAVVERVYAKHCPDDLRDAVGLVSHGLEAAA